MQWDYYLAPYRYAELVTTEGDIANAYSTDGSLDMASNLRKVQIELKGVIL